MSPEKHYATAQPVLFDVAMAKAIVAMEEKMGETGEKATRAKQTGMALEMDVIKKITHQLERLPHGQGAEMRIMTFMTDWSTRRAIVHGARTESNGQLPLAAKDGFPE